MREREFKTKCEIKIGRVIRREKDAKQMEEHKEGILKWITLNLNTAVVIKVSHPFLIENGYNPASSN